MNSLTVTMKYLVNFCEKTGKGREEVLFENGADLHTVAEWLQQSYGLTVPAANMISLLNGHGWNQHPEKMKTKIKDGDVIIIMPQISGG